jgi:hypothetical protein
MNCYMRNLLRLRFERLPRILFGVRGSTLVFHHPDCAYFGVGDLGE